MKFYLIVFSLIISITSYSQSQKLDTIEVGYNKTVIVIFETDITTEDVGSPDLLAEKEGKIIKLLAAIPNMKETSLFVETGDGYYSFIIRYSPSPGRLSIMMPASKVTYQKVKKIASEDPGITSGGVTGTTNQTPIKTLPLEKDNTLYKDCQEIASKPVAYNDLAVIGPKCSMMLQDIYVKNDLLYFKVLIKNNSNIDYDIELIRFVIRNKKGAVKASAVQEQIPELVYTYNGDVNEVKGKDGVIKVFVFKKFTYSSEKRLYIELWENGGDRILSFFAEDTYVINCKKLN